MAAGRDRQYWTLSEAAAWVVFRSDAVVQKFSPPTADDFQAFMFYPSMRQEHPETGKMSDLFDALRAGRLNAIARRNQPGATISEIPVAEWSDLVADVRGPYRHLDNRGKDYPWINIQVLRSDVEKLWRRTSEKQGRTRFDWNRLKELWLDLKKHNPDLSQNELIGNLQDAYQDETGKEPPSRVSIQRHLRNW